MLEINITRQCWLGYLQQKWLSPDCFKVNEIKYVKTKHIINNSQI